MNAEQSRMDWNFVALWAAVSALTFAAATAVAYVSMWTIGGSFLEGLAAPVAAAVSGAWVGGLMGLGLGGGQAVALRRSGVSAARWALYTAAGGAIAFALFSVLTAQGESPRTSLALLAGGALGLGFGVAQWIILKSRSNGAIAWIPMMVVVFLPVMWIAYNLGGEGREWLALSAMGLTAGGLTALAAAWLFGGRNPSIAVQVGVLLALGVLLSACGGAAGPSVRFVEPRDGATVGAPVRVVMAAENFTVEPAGEVRDGAGHLHIMVDAPCIAAGEAVPKDDQHLHYGDGSVEAELALPPGSHTLCLQAADGAHIALPGEGMTHSITVNVP